MQASQPSPTPWAGPIHFHGLLCANHRAPQDWLAWHCGILGRVGGATASLCDMESQGLQGRYRGQDTSTGPNPTEGDITRPTGFNDGAIVNPSVVSGTEETVAVTMLTIGTFVVG